LNAESFVLRGNESSGHRAKVDFGARASGSRAALVGRRRF
jgi:hypothetical protein